MATWQTTPTDRLNDWLRSIGYSKLRMPSYQLRRMTCRWMLTPNNRRYMRLSKVQKSFKGTCTWGWSSWIGLRARILSLKNRKPCWRTNCKCWGWRSKMREKGRCFRRTEWWLWNRCYKKKRKEHSTLIQTEKWSCHSCTLGTQMLLTNIKYRSNRY